MTTADAVRKTFALQEPLDPAVHARRWVTLGVLCLSLMIIVMDNTILNVAIPSLMEDLHASNTDIQWIIDAYTLVFACLLLTTGSLSDRFGRKGALQIGIALFGLGSISAALSDSVTHLIVSRAFMGIGGALIMPSTLSILTNVFRDPKERGRAIAIWAGFSGLSVAIGPVTGGLLLEHFEWSSVFWVNIPIGLAALGLGFFFVPTSRDPNQGKIDIPGAVLSVITLGALLFGIIEGPVRGWTDGLVLAGFGVAVVGAISFISWELHVDEPMLDMRFFANPRFSAANGAITMTFFALFGSMFLMTQYWQLVHGYSPLGAGVRLIPYALCMMITAPLSARLVERLGSKRVITTGLSIVALSLLTLSFIHATTPYPRVIIVFCVMAVGMGMTMAPATESVMGSLPREKAGVGSAVNDTTRQVGGALGVAIIGSIVTSVYSSRVTDVAGRFDVRGESLARAKDSLANAIDVGREMSTSGTSFIDDVKDAFVGSLSIGLRFSASVIVVAALVVWKFLPARSADALADHSGEAAEVTPGDPTISVAAGGR
ncbi:MFS transporter [Desertimonas flava]|uniref:MFS transporter n=1 Tax=Desertimonas flava TaxID=2064846 RepID=UPI001D0C6F9A|nr:MFS transporter [Desertimonas flava]